MTIRTHYLAAAAAIGALAVPAAAQTAYPYGYQQTYPQQTYPQQAYPPTLPTAIAITRARQAIR